LSSKKRRAADTILDGQIIAHTCQKRGGSYLEEVKCMGEGRKSNIYIKSQELKLPNSKDMGMTYVFKLMTETVLAQNKDNDCVRSKEGKGSQKARNHDKGSINRKKQIIQSAKYLGGEGQIRHLEGK